MNFVSLFAGVGGFDLAFERAGMECVAQVESDTRCWEVLATHWPDVPRFEDVHDVTASRIQMATGEGRRDVGDRNGNGPQLGNDADTGSLLLRGDLRGGVRTVDLLCGGFPCQDYSVAGKRGGLAGDRGALWWQFHRLIAECRPRWVVGENVPGLLSSNGGRDFGAIVGSLVELGYGVIWRVLDAQYFGVAQRRRRVFIVGHSGGIPRPEILAFAEGCTGDTPPSRQPGERVAPSLANRARGGGGLGTDVELDGGLIAQTVTTGTGLRYDPETETLVAFAQNTRDEVRDLHDLAGALAAQPGMKQTTYLAVQGGSQQDQFIRPDGVVPTLAHASNTHTGHHEPKAWIGNSVRRLTPLECERLQGFPDNWTTGQSDTQRYRQMGNAVAVPVAEWLGRRLVAA